MRETPIEFQSFPLHQDSADKDLFTAGGVSVREHKESYLPRPGGPERRFWCWLQCPRSACSLAVKKLSSLREEGLSPARAAERSLVPSKSRDSHRLKKRSSTQPDGLDLEPALRNLLHKKRLLSRAEETNKVMTSLLWSETAR